MSSEWDNGVMQVGRPSWHRLEKLVKMVTAEDMISEAEKCGAWPIELMESALLCSNGLVVPDSLGTAIVAKYTNHPDRVVGINGSRYRVTSPEEWRALIHAAKDAGAQVDGGFSLRDGKRVVACFRVATEHAEKAGKIDSYLMLCDSFDGTMKLTCGLTSVRVQCANTIAMALRQDGGGMARIRHDGNAADKIKDLTQAISVAIKHGHTVAKTMAKAADARLNRDSFQELFNKLFPDAPKDASSNAKTRAYNRRSDALRACSRKENKIDDGQNVATLWNAATFLVDREADGSLKTRKGSDPADTMLFGARGKQVQEIQTIIEVYLNNGKLVQMTAPEAIEAGVPKDQVGKAVLKDMLGGQDLWDE